jgi:hypothetical protein
MRSWGKCQAGTLIMNQLMSQATQHREFRNGFEARLESRNLQPNIDRQPPFMSRPATRKEP